MISLRRTYPYRPSMTTRTDTVLTYAWAALMLAMALATIAMEWMKP